MSLVEVSKEVVLKSGYFDEVLVACRSLLKSHPIASAVKGYLNSRVSAHNQEAFEFGYFPEDEYLSTLLSMVSKDKLERLGLIYPKHIADSSQVNNAFISVLSNHNLIMPYKDLYGNTIAIVGRTLLPIEKQKELGIPKYKNTPFIKSIHLFNLNRAKYSIINENRVFIVEGQMDCITAHGNGFHNVVALGGVAMSQFQFSLLTRYTNNLCLVLDNDEAGSKASVKLRDKYGAMANVSILELPSGYKDVDEYLTSSDDCSALVL